MTVTPLDQLLTAFHAARKVDGYRTDLPEGLTPHALNGLTVPITITDARHPENPLIFVSDSFCRMTGYARADIVGRNCRFLQGENTDPDAVHRIRRAITERRADSIDLINYRNGGQAFMNRLLIAPLYDGNGAISHFLGIQNEVFDSADDPLTPLLQRPMPFPRVAPDRIEDLLEDMADGDADARVFAWNTAKGTLYTPKPLHDDGHRVIPLPSAQAYFASIHGDDLPRVHGVMAGAFNSPNAAYEVTFRHNTYGAWRTVHAAGRFVYVGDSHSPTVLCVILPVDTVPEDAILTV